MTEHVADFLIIGNCAAGISAAEAIRGTDSNASVLIVSDEPYAAYGRPLISYLIEGVSHEDSLWLRGPRYYEENRFGTLFGEGFKVVSLDSQSHIANLACGDSVRYGKCLIATGASPFIPETPGLDGKSNVFTFTTLDQAKALWAEAESVSEFAHEQGRESCVVVMGAGLIGMKAAEALASVVDRVIVVGRAPFILRAVLDLDAASMLQGRLEERGLVFRTGVTASEYLADGDRITGAVLSDGSSVSCDLVVMAAGVRPNCAFAVEAGAQFDRGLVVDDCQRTSLTDVFAAGDVAQVVNVLDGTLAPLAQWPNAVAQGRMAGLAMAGAPCGAVVDGFYPVNSTNFFDSSVLTCGLTNPPSELGFEVKVRSDGEQYAKFVMKDNRLFGYVLLNAPQNAGIYTQIISKGMRLDSLPEQIFERPVENIDFPDPACFNRLQRGCPAGFLSAREA